MLKRLLLFTLCYLALADLPLTHVFKNGAKSDTKTYPNFRYPGLFIYNGVIFAFADGRQSCADWGTHDIVLTTSNDNGKTWSPLRTLVDAPKIFSNSKAACWDPTPVVDESTGKLFVHFAVTYHNEPKGLEHKFLFHPRDAYYSIESSDMGKTWSEPKNLTKQCFVYAPGKQEPTFITSPASGHGLQTSSGRLIVPTFGKNYSHICYSDDHGETWQVPQIPVGIHSWEGIIVETFAGDLMYNLRYEWDPQDCAPGIPHCRQTTISKDDGLTWGHVSNVPALPDPQCKGSIARWPKHKALVFCNPNALTKRVNETVRISFDDGKTWPSSYFVSEGSGYSEIGITPNDKIINLFEYGCEGIVAAIFDPLASVLSE